MNVFPRHDIDPKKKDDKWVLQAVKAAWDESSTLGTNKGFYHNRHRFRELRDYALGNQSVNKYKNQIEPKDANGNSPETFVQLDYTIIPFIPKFRKIALGKVMSFGHNIVATAIDPLAREQEDDYFADIKAKLELIQQLQDVPGIEKMVGLEETDPRTMEEVDIKRRFSYKHIAAMEVEQGLDLVMHNNKYSKIEEKIDQDIFDFGVGGCRDYFDENGVIKIRHVKPYAFQTSYCEEPDFSDARYMYEVIDMTLEDIRKESGFSEEIMEKIAEVKGKQVNYKNDFQKPYSKPYDDQKVTVVDFEYKTVDDMVFEKRVNSRGNKEVRRAPFSKVAGPYSNKEYSRSQYQVIYKCKWVVGTDFVWDAGRVTNMKRKKNSLTETRFSFHMYAPSQDQMRFFGVVEAMIPVADQIQISWLKLQNLLLKQVPPGIAFDLSALENINLGHAGKEWSPRKVIEMYYQRGDMPYRSLDQEGSPKGNVPITPITNMVMQEANNMMMLINSFMGLLRDNIGFNEITDGSSPDPRMLKSVANLAYQSTSQALSHLIIAKKRINEELSEDLVIRMQDAFSAGKVTSYRRALGAATQQFFSVQSDIALHEIAVKIEDRPSEEEKARLEQKVQIAIQSGQITIADSIELDMIPNMKERAAVLAFRVKKNQESRQQEQMMLSQQNAQAQQQSAMVAEDEKRKTMEFEYTLKLQYLQTEKQLEAQIKQMELEARLQEAGIREQGRTSTKQIENQGKRETKAMDMMMQNQNPPMESAT
jgi:hypothetical protein